MRPSLVLLLVLAFSALGPGAALAEAPLAPADPLGYATFALIIGVNTSVDAGAQTLRYADDDAARYLDLFRSLGARTYVLARPDDNTRRIHPQVVAEALLPIQSDFTRAVTSLAHDVEQARKRRVKTVLYFVYAGHGNVDNGRGYITLEDAQLDGRTLDAEVVDRVGADQTHFIVDACDSYFLALGRGPGGERHESHGFAGLGGLRQRDSVGLLLSTSTARESHEWAGVQAGVFSHEVRSGLYGAADADGDGQVSYREVSAFVSRANGAIPNERYRSDVYARAPKDSPVLLDLRGKLRSRIEVPGTHAGHYFLEDGAGVRILDFHNDVHQTVAILRPRNAGRLYLHRVSDGASALRAARSTLDDVEFLVPGEPEVVALADLTALEPRSRARGAANDAFESLFALPFDRKDVDASELRPPVDGAPLAREGDGARYRRYGGLGLVGAGAASSVAAVLTLASARNLRGAVGPTTTQSAAAAANDGIRARNVAAGVELALGGAAVLSGVVLLLWPASPPPIDLGASAHSGQVTLHGTF